MVLLNCLWYNKQFLSETFLHANLKYKTSAWACRNQWTACGISRYNWIIFDVTTKLDILLYKFLSGQFVACTAILLQVSRYETSELGCCNSQDLNSKICKTRPYTLIKQSSHCIHWTCTIFSYIGETYLVLNSSYVFVQWCMGWWKMPPKFITVIYPRVYARLWLITPQDAT